MLLRPYATILEGKLEIGLEILLDPETKVIQEIRPHTGLPEDYILSPAFLNAHSHLEYRGLLGKIPDLPWFEWLREIARLKSTQTPGQILVDARQAAAENRATGIAFLAEHTDRPAAATALAEAKIPAHLYQELIVLPPRDDPQEKTSLVQSRADEANSQTQGLPIQATVNLHAVYTVAPEALAACANPPRPLSIHCAESPAENDFTRTATGPWADLLASLGAKIPPTGLSVVQTLHLYRLLTPQTQLVHCCDIDHQDIALIAQTGATVAHCPRSNQALSCPPAPLRELLEAQIPVALGLDSPASSGPVDMLAEMRSALHTSWTRGRPVPAEQIWRLATTSAESALRRQGLANIPDLRIAPGARPPLLAIHLPDALSTEDVIDRATPAHIQWITPPDWPN